MSCGIYKITNLINNKVYIGQSVNIEKRIISHKNTGFNPKNSSYDYPLYKAIRKYGLENFSFEIIEELNKDLLNDREKYWISYYNSNNKNFGYNQTDGGDTGTFKTLSWESVEQIIELLMTTGKSQEEIAKLFNVSQMAISDINTGSFWHKNYLKYPLRKYAIKKKRNFCIDCNIEISLDAIRCQKCNSVYERRVQRPSREELKDLIRNYPFTQLGKKFGVSDNAINRKWCDSYSLPRKSSEIKKYSDEEWKNI